MKINIKKDTLYSRKECINLIRDYIGEPAQSAYFKVWNKSKTYVLNKAVFIKKESIYDDQITSRNEIQWNDSIGQKAESGDRFLSGSEGVYIFHEGNSSPMRYYFVGKMKKFRRIAIGNKEDRIPSKFLIELEEKISLKAYDSFSDPIYVEKNREIRENALNKAYGTIDPVKASLIGEAGERIFYETLNEKKYFYSDVKKFLKGIDIRDFIWENQKDESFKPYDFRINGELYDVKSTITNNEKFFVSSAELELIKKDKLNIVIIWLDEKLNFKRQKIVRANSILSIYKFEGKNYLATRR